MTYVLYARTYAVEMQDERLFEDLLTRVIERLRGSASRAAPGECRCEEAGARAPGRARGVVLMIRLERRRLETLSFSSASRLASSLPLCRAAVHDQVRHARPRGQHLDQGDAGVRHGGARGQRRAARVQAVSRAAWPAMRRTSFERSGWASTTGADSPVSASERWRRRSASSTHRSCSSGATTRWSSSAEIRKGFRAGPRGRRLRPARLGGGRIHLRLLRASWSHVPRGPEEP